VIRLSKLADYGSQIMMHMATDESMHSASEIAASLGISVPTVSKILKMLARENLVVSVLGAKGGYMLARRPAEISIADIIGAMDGPISITECSGASTCDRESVCSTKGNWRNINQVILGALEQVKLTEMMPRKQQVVRIYSTRPRQVS
jgi:FeS assembly SUF system regulator